MNIAKSKNSFTDRINSLQGPIVFTKIESRKFDGMTWCCCFPFLHDFFVSLIFLKSPLEQKGVNILLCDKMHSKWTHIDFSVLFKLKNRIDFYTYWSKEKFSVLYWHQKWAHFLRIPTLDNQSTLSNAA